MPEKAWEIDHARRLPPGAASSPPPSERRRDGRRSGVHERPGLGLCGRRQARMKLFVATVASPLRRGRKQNPSVAGGSSASEHWRQAAAYHPSPRNLLRRRPNGASWLQLRRRPWGWWRLRFRCYAARKARGFRWRRLRRRKRAEEKP